MGNRKVYLIGNSKPFEHNIKGILEIVGKTGVIELEKLDDKEILEAANYLTHFQILKRTNIEKSLRGDVVGYYVIMTFTDGPNFSIAKSKGVERYIKEKKKEENPGWWKRNAKTLSENPLIVAVISALLGALIAYFMK